MAGIMTSALLYNFNKKKKSVDVELEEVYNPVFDSYWKKKSLYPLCLLGYSDFCRCFEL